jgi:hypothetical protein
MMIAYYAHARNHFNWFAAAATQLNIAIKTFGHQTEFFCFTKNNNLSDCFKYKGPKVTSYKPSAFKRN